MYDLYKNLVKTPCGDMETVAGEQGIYYLGFKQESCSKVQNLLSNSTYGENSHILQLREELSLYFQGKLKRFKTALVMSGSGFQKHVWRQLIEIPFGETQSYKEIARRIEKPKASRAIGNANSLNMHAIIVPCHRVIKSDGSLGGYYYDLWRKEWLIKHEKKIIASCI